MASAALVAAACGSGGAGPGSGVTRADLLALARIDSFNPPPATVRTLNNSTLNTVTIVHPDGGSTLFAEFQFPAHSVLFANGAAVCDSCLYTVSISVTPGLYGFTLTPADLVFRLSSTPTVTVGYATYGDLSVYAQSPRYPSAAAFEQALALWYERTPGAGAWVEGRNSGHIGPATIASAIDVPGQHLIAALR